MRSSRGSTSSQKNGSSFEVVDEREADAAQAGAAQVGERLRDLVRIADHQQAAHAVDVVVALALELLLADGRGEIFFLPRMPSTADQSPFSIVA